MRGCDRPNAGLQAFLEREIAKCQLFPVRTERDRNILAEADVLVAGSDMVWRPKLANLDSVFFAWTTPARKISYAASFGVSDGSEYPDELARYTGELIKDFHSVSVREKSAIQICRDLWGINPTCVLEPVLLFTQEFWDELIDSDSDSSNFGPSASCYLTDQGAVTRDFALTICRHYQLEPLVLPPTVSSLMDFVRSTLFPQKYVMPDPRSWLRSIRNSALLVTDSYHPVAFAILFRVEFVVLDAGSQDLSRTRALLDLFGLGSRIVQQFSSDQKFEPISWDSVHDDLSEFRAASLEFLRAAITANTK